MPEAVTYRREAGKLDMQAEPMLLNIGPSHPATHATLRLIAELDGETILKLTPEFSRILDHMVCIGTNMVDLGALTNFWYFWKPREEVYMHLIEPLTGTRLTTGYTRIGGVGRGLPDGWAGEARGGIETVL